VELLSGDEARIEITERAAEVSPQPFTRVLQFEDLKVPLFFCPLQKLRAISMSEHESSLALRIAVESGGCHGYQYKMELTSEQSPDD